MDWKRKFQIFLLLAGAILFYIYGNYVEYRNMISINKLNKIEDERVLRLINELEEKAMPEVKIEYYYFDTSSTLNEILWQSRINGAYSIIGAWPFKQREIIAVSDVCIKYLSDNELKALLGHELGHMKYDHQFRNGGIGMANYHHFLVILASFGSRSAQEAIKRKHIIKEFEADDYSVLLTSPEDALTLLKLADDGAKIVGRNNFLEIRRKRLEAKWLDGVDK